mmetsp:Transcript_21987/g.50129  ORF Transcript_21987/g.50129 Transcript_21987/m.50129 type:complete len:214 (-) Transcript_21987:2425-3066(-)
MKEKSLLYKTVHQERNTAYMYSALSSKTVPRSGVNSLEQPPHVQFIISCPFKFSIDAVHHDMSRERALGRDESIELRLQILPLAQSFVAGGIDGPLPLQHAQIPLDLMHAVPLRLVEIGQHLLLERTGEGDVAGGKDIEGFVGAEDRLARQGAAGVGADFGLVGLEAVYFVAELLAGVIAFLHFLFVFGYFGRIFGERFADFVFEFVDGSKVR